MKTMKTTIIAVLTACIVAPAVSAGGYPGYPTISPTMPFGVFAEGRKAVVDYLTHQVDHTAVNILGDSVISRSPGDGSRFFSRSDLANNGYVHDGSFAELQAAMSALYTVEVVPSPHYTNQTVYDVKVKFSAYGNDGSLLFTGNDWPVVQENPDGTLANGTAEPFVSLNDIILVAAPNVVTAKWIGPLFGQSQDLFVMNPGATNALISYQTADLGSGYLALSQTSGSPGGSVATFLVNLLDGTSVSGKDLRIVFDKLLSTDLKVVQKLDDIASLKPFFYLGGNGQIYGRYPLLEVTLAGPTQQLISPSVTVWGTKQVLYPRRITVHVVTSPSAFPSDVLDLPYKREAGGWGVMLPAGTYHLDVDFDAQDEDSDQTGGPGLG